MAVNIFEKSTRDYSDEISRIYNNIATVYDSIHDYDAALVYYLKAASKLSNYS